MVYRHIPVMRDEAIEYLNCSPGKHIVDCTLGGAGHAEAIIEKILPDGLLIGIDQDADAVENAKRVLSPHASNIRLIHDNFVNLPHILFRLGVRRVDGILADLGLSFYQIASAGRGFSFSRDEPLDMRMNLSNPLTAASLVNTEEEGRLKTIFKDLGEERWAGRIAREIVAQRRQKSIETSAELARIVRSAIPKKDAAKRKIDPATKVFMALRIAVNRELEVLDQFLGDAVASLAAGGRICVISFHSLEDRIVKKHFKDRTGGCECPPDFPVCICDRKAELKVLTRKVRRPSEKECADNPMARSAKLRVAEKLP